jgi:hypothetical protein
MPASPQLEQPFVVFISSKQSEFEQFRQELKETIDTERWSNQRPMRAILIENERGSVIDAEIKRELDRSSIYVGVFGQKWSDWTVAEFRYARSLGLPLLVYRFGRGGSGRPGKKSEVTKFVRDEVRQTTRVREPYTKLGRLSDAIMSDLVIQACEMVRESSDIRKRLNPGTIKALT